MPEIEFSQTQKSTNMLNLYAFNGLKSDGKVYGLRDLPTVWGLKVINWYDAHFKEGVDSGLYEGRLRDRSRSVRTRTIFRS